MLINESLNVLSFGDDATPVTISQLHLNE